MRMTLVATETGIRYAEGTAGNDPVAAVVRRVQEVDISYEDLYATLDDISAAYWDPQEPPMQDPLRVAWHKGYISQEAVRQ